MSVKPAPWLLPVFLALLSVSACKSIHPPTSANYQSRLGVAVKSGSRVCMAIRNAHLLPGALITLLSPIDSASNSHVATARALISLRGTPLCAGARTEPVTGKTEEGLTGYSLEIESGSVADGTPLVALDARVPSVYAAHSFHVCKSGDGVFLSAWDGAKPLEGHRLWHQYYDLGRNANENCTAAETVAY